MKTIQWIGVNLTLQIFRKYYFVDSSGNSSIISVGKADDFNFYDKRLYVKKGFDYRRIAWNSYFGRSSRIFSSLKGQLISEWLFDVLNFPKNQQKKIWQIFAQESNK